MITFKHIVWDWNGTLLDDAHFSFQKTCEVLSCHGMQVPSFEYYRDHFGFPVEEFLLPLGLSDTKRSTAELAGEFGAAYNESLYVSCELHRGTVDILESLAAAGHRHHVLSAREHDRLVEDIWHYGVARYFDRVEGARSSGSHMGKLHQGRELLVTASWNPRDVVLVGDTAHDFQIARELGIACVLLAAGQNSYEKLTRSAAPFIARDHCELIAKLELASKLTDELYE